jgi:hypothetical protein
MPVGVGVGVGDGEEGGFEEIDTLPPHALITNKTERIGAERKIGQRLELAAGVIEGRLFTERIGSFECLRRADQKHTLAMMRVHRPLEAAGKLRCSHLWRQFK